MAVAFVQGSGAQSVGSVASLSKAFVSNTTAGNAICVGGAANGATLTNTSVSDGTNTYNNVDIKDDTAGGNAESATWYAKNIAGGAVTVTIDPTGSDFCNISIAEFSGVDTTAPLDGHNTVTSDTPNAGVSTGTWTTTANGVIFGHFEHNGGTTTITESGTGVVLIAEAETAVNTMPFNAIYKLDNSPGSGKSAGVWTTGVNVPMTACGFSLKEASAGTTQPAVIGPAYDVPNPNVGPMVMRRLWRQPYLLPSDLAPVTDTNFILPTYPINPTVGPMVLRVTGRRPKPPIDNQQAPSDTNFIQPTYPENKTVGPMAIRQVARQPYVPLDVRAPITDTEFGIRVALVPNQNVGPMVLRQFAARLPKPIADQPATRSDSNFVPPIYPPSKGTGPQVLRVRPLPYLPLPDLAPTTNTEFGPPLTRAPNIGVGPMVLRRAPVQSFPTPVSTSGSFTQSLSGTLTFSGVFTKLVLKSLAGTITPSGALAKSDAKPLAGTITPSGTIAKQCQEPRTGTLTPSGALTRQDNKSVSGTLTPSGSLAKRVIRALVGTITLSGLMTKTTVRLASFAATLSMTGALGKFISRALTGLMSLGGLLTTQIEVPEPVVEFLLPSKDTTFLVESRSTTYLVSSKDTTYLLPPQ